MEGGYFSSHADYFSFATIEVDGHDVSSLQDVLSALPIRTDAPTAVICHTIKGRGISFAEGQADWHHKSRLSAGDIEQLYQALGGR